MTTVEQDLTVRPASAADRPSVLALLDASLGWESDDRHADFFSWKHERNPFGPSPAWVAVDRDGRLLGFRAFLRWEFTQGSAVLRAARAVDTATRPDVQRRGIFSRLTTTAIEGLVRDEVAFVFNTPNRQSLPGYLKMGWQRVGRLPVRARSPSVRRWRRLIGARCPADKWSLLTGAGAPASDAFADTDSVARLLAGLGHTEGLSTRVGVEYLRWRYGFPALRYRVVTAGPTVEDGTAVFRFRRRGTAVEAVICDLLVPGGSETRGGALSSSSRGCRRGLRAVPGTAEGPRLSAVARPRTAAHMAGAEGHGEALIARLGSEPR
jgi:GNAT superfamily N-acetyltransferase